MPYLSIPAPSGLGFSRENRFLTEDGEADGISTTTFVLVREGLGVQPLPRENFQLLSPRMRAEIEQLLKGEGLELVL